MKFNKQQKVAFILGIVIPYVILLTGLILCGFFKKLFGK
jgi:hypothetical protein